jgi:hypothetical protein
MPVQILYLSSQNQPLTMRISVTCFSFITFIFAAFCGHSQGNPVAYAGPDLDICVGDTVQLQGIGSGAGPNYTYQWAPNTNISDPTISNPLVWPSSDISYSLVVTSNSLNSAPDTINVRSHPIPTVNAGADQDICLGDTAQLNAVGSGDPSAVYQFDWTPAASLTNASTDDPQAYPLQTTTYFAAVSSLWGCEGEPDSVTVHIRPTPIAFSGQNSVVCIGDSFALNGSYGWTTPDTLPAAQVSNMWSPGTTLADSTNFNTTGYAAVSHWLYLQVNAGLCSHIDSVFITAFPQPTPVVTQSGNTLTAGGGLGGGTYQWFINNVAIPGANNTIYNFVQPGCYHVTITEGDCSGESDTLCVQEVGIIDWANLHSLDIFPNPFEDQLRVDIELTRSEELSFELIDITGKVIKVLPVLKLGPGKHSLPIEVANLSKGLVLLRIQGKTGMAALRLLHF